MATLDTDLPTFVSELESLWFRYRDGLVQADRLVRSIIAKEKTLLAGSHEFECFGGSDTIEELLLETAKRLRVKLVSRAIQTFSPDGARLEINSDHYGEEWLHKSRHGGSPPVLNFSPSRIWREIESRYGGEAGQRAAYAAAIKKINSAFNLRNASMRIVSGFAEIEAQIYTEDVYGRKDVRRLGYSMRTSMTQAINALMAFLTWHEGTVHTEANRVLCRAVQLLDGSFSSRTSVECPTLKVTLFYNKLVVRMALPIAERLNEFFALYGEELVAG